MLGQHVYVEMDYGQGEEKDGLWLGEYYIVQDGDKSYVWAESDGRLEKREVTLGEYNQDMCTYEILSGISADDYIAFPEDTLKEGTKTTHNYEDVIDTSMPDEEIYPDGEEVYPDGEMVMPEGEEAYPDGEMTMPEGEEAYPMEDGVDTSDTDIGNEINEGAY